MRILYFILISLCLIFINRESYSQTVIASFEEENDLTNINITAGVEVSLSTDFPALNKFSCKAVFPEKGGALYLNKIELFNWNSIEGNNYGKDEVLHLFVWSEKVTNLTLSVEDSLNKVFAKKYSIKKGVNHLQLLLAQAKEVNFKKIQSIGIGSGSNDVFYIDYISLDQYQPVLEKLGRWDVEYSTEIQSPHYRWGDSLAGGPIKSYSISPVFDGRGIIELAERLDMDFKVATIGRTSGEDKWGFGDFYARRDPGSYTDEGGDPYNLAQNYIAEDLLFSPKFDVIIWPGIQVWESYPEQVRNAILERVKEGTGLVLLYPISELKDDTELWTVSPLKSFVANSAQKPIPDSETWTIPLLDLSPWSQTKTHYITRGISFEAFPYASMGIFPYQNNLGEVLIKTDKGNPVLAISNYGRGRVIAMAYPERGLIPRVDNPWGTGLNYPYWEYMWSLLARSVVWASHKEPEVYIENVKKTPEGISIDMQNNTKGASLLVKVIDDFGIVEEESTLLLRSKQSHADLPFRNKLNGGGHIVNVTLKGEEGVYDWFSLMFHTPKTAEIVSVKNEKSEIPVGEKVHSSVILKSDMLVNGTLTVRLYDNYERLVDEIFQEVSFSGEKELNIALESENIITNFGKSEYILDINGYQADHQVQEHFFLQPRLWDDYDITMYHFGPNPVPGVWPAVDRQLQELNVTTLAAYTLDNSKHANYKVQAQTRINGVESPDMGPDLEYYKEMKRKYLETGDKNLLIRKFGLKDSVFLKSVHEELKSKVGSWKKFSPSAYYIFEEPSITRYDDALDLCFAKTTLIAMRGWLKDQYLTLEALNKQWGTIFKAWDDIVPDDSREARLRGNYSSWADHRTFMEICWADLFKFVQNTVNEVDPGGLVQLSGTQAASSHNGYDYSLLNQYVGQMNPYDIDNQLEYHHTFNPGLKVSGQAGYGALGKGVLYDYYNHLFLKETGGSYIFWQISSLNPDLRINQSGMDMKNGFDEMRKRGIGRLISSYEPENELKIAIHYSYPSIHAAWITDGEIVLETEKNGSETLVQFNKNRDGWVKILHDMGLGFNFISYSNIEKGGLISNGYKILILPMSMALSDLEVKNIRDFVKQGGIVIADALPGVMDNHTKFRENRELADMFGIEARSYSREELITPGNESDLNVTSGEVLAKENNKLQLIHNKYGKGAAYLLNYFMDKYPQEKLNHSTEASLYKIRKILDREHLKSGIQIFDSEGNPEPGIEKYAFSDVNGETRLLGLLPGKEGEDKEVVLHFESPVNLYDIRNKKYFGIAKEFKINIKNSTPELFGLLKSKIEDIKIISSSQLNTGENFKIDFNITGENISEFNSVATMEVMNPKGEKISYYSKNCAIKNGAGSYSFNVAVNDPKGEWKIRMTEVISNIQKEVTFKVN